MVKRLDQYDFGAGWGFLSARGWKFVPSVLARGTAACDGPNKRILVKPSVFARPNVRVRRYVVPHEIWHALHYEFMGYECPELMAAYGLNWKSAVEVVADAGCLIDDRSRAMRAWVHASVVWHGRVGYKYSMKHVQSPEAAAVVELLRQGMQGLPVAP